jgi:hypothetical protein
MPRYKNSTGDTVTPIGAGPSVADGGVLSIHEYLSDPAGLTLTKHAQPGFAGKVLFSGNPNDSTVETYQHDWIVIYNGTDAEIQLTPNTDTDNQWVVGTLKTVCFQNFEPRCFYNLKISGSGTGNAYIMGCHNKIEAD